MTPAVQTFAGPLDPGDLGETLIHEHLFVGDPELELNHPHPEWDRAAAVERAVAGLESVHALGVRTVVDLTVLGLGRDVALVEQVAARVPVHLVASTGYYTAHSLPPFFQLNGPGRVVDGPDPLVEYFLSDIEQGIAGTAVRAGMLKVVTDEPGLTPDVRRVFEAAAVAHQQTGVPITTHSHAASRNGLDQQALLRSLGVGLDRVVIGHSGDSPDLDHLRTLADAGSMLGFDRFGMEHLAPDAQRIDTAVRLIELGYSDRLLFSHDAAFFSRVTPPSWRARHAPSWHVEHLHRTILPRLRARGVDEATLQMIIVDNPRRLLTPGR